MIFSFSVKLNIRVVPSLVIYLKFNGFGERNLLGPHVGQKAQLKR